MQIVVKKNWDVYSLDEKSKNKNKCKNYNTSKLNKARMLRTMYEFLE